MKKEEKKQKNLQRLSLISGYASGALNALNDSVVNKQTGKIFSKTRINAINKMAKSKSVLKKNKLVGALALGAGLTSLGSDIARSRGFGDFIMNRLESTAASFGGAATGVVGLKATNKLSGKVKFIRKGGRVIPIRVK